MLLAAERSAEEIVRRSCLPGKKEINHVSMYIELATLALTRDDGRRRPGMAAAGPAIGPQRPFPNGNQWEIEELRFRSRFEPPSLWVPRLSLVLSRVKNSQRHTGYLTRVLFEMGLVRVVPDPDDSAKKVLDPSPLQAVLAQYGPRITTANRRVGDLRGRGRHLDSRIRAGARFGFALDPGLPPTPSLS